METTIVYWGYIGIMEKRMETTIVYWGYSGIMEKRMETTIVYCGYIGIMEKKMEPSLGFRSKQIQRTSWLQGQRCLYRESIVRRGSKQGLGFRVSVRFRV